MKRTSAYKLFVFAILIVLASVSLVMAQDMMELPEATDSGMAPVNDIEMYYATYGDPENTPVLLIHGGLGNADHWVNQIDAFLAEDYYVITADSRGHGRSTMSEQQIGYDLMTSDYLALLDFLEVDAVHLVGFSDGGIIGLNIAINNPDRLMKLVAYGANYTIDGVRSDVDDSERFNEYVEMIVVEYLEMSPNPDNLDPFIENISNMWATEPAFTEEEMMGIELPVLILDGIEEEAIYSEHALEMAKLIPNADLVLMSGVGHFAMWDKTEAFNKIVLDYLAD